MNCCMSHENTDTGYNSKGVVVPSGGYCTSYLDKTKLRTTKGQSIDHTVSQVSSIDSKKNRVPKKMDG